jgi:hypothetical protein
MGFSAQSDFLFFCYSAPYSPDMAMPDPLQGLARCPRRNHMHNPCQVTFPDRTG